MNKWIEWNGGECPVRQGKLVDVRYRDGEEIMSLPADELAPSARDASQAYWDNDGNLNDIVAYRLAEPERTLEEAYEDADRPISDGYGGSALNEQVAGNHYLQFEIQPIEFINANKFDFLAGNVVKYISRHKLKCGADDVKKAIHYCKLILELQYGEDK